MSDIIFVAILIVLELLVLRQLYGIGRAWIIPYYKGISPLSQIDNSILDTQEEPPADNEQISNLLNSLGFRFLGRVPLEHIGRPGRYIEWIYVSEDGEICFLVYFDKSGSPHISFVTYFHDNAVIASRYPSGYKIETSDFVSKFSNVSPEVALQHQVFMINQWNNVKGRIPRRISTLEDFVEARDTAYSKHYKISQRPALRMFLIYSVLGIIFIISNGLTLLFMAIYDEPNSSVTLNISWVVIFVAVLTVWLNKKSTENPRNAIDPSILETESE